MHLGLKNTYPREEYLFRAMLSLLWRSGSLPSFPLFAAEKQIERSITRAVRKLSDLAPSKTYEDPRLLNGIQGFSFILGGTCSGDPVTVQCIFCSATL